MTVFHAIPTTLVLVLASVAATHAGTVNGIRAVVHDHVITMQEVNERNLAALDNLRRQYRGQEAQIADRMAKADQENLEELSRRKLIMHEFSTAGYNIPESVIDEIVDDRIRSKYGDRRTAAKSLQEEGITIEKFRERMREQFIVEAMRNKNIAAEIIISPQKVETFYNAHKDEFAVEEQVNVRMIELRPATGSGADSKKLAGEILFKIKEGVSFSELAAIHSVRAQRGDSGEWFNRAGLRTEIAEAIKDLKAGETSNVIETPDAVYLVHISEVKAAHFKPLEDVRATIESSLLQDERNRLETQWVEKLKRKTFVRRF